MYYIRLGTPEARGDMIMIVTADSNTFVVERWQSITPVKSRRVTHHG